ncbi:MAG: alpha/beta hydrolase [Terriglobales bacterium]
MRRRLTSRFLVCLLLLPLHPGAVWAQAPKSVGHASARPSVPVEDWSSLSLAGSHLRAEKPVPGGRADLPKFTRELVQVKWREGDPIDLYVIRPKGVAKPPVVLYLYSYPSETDRFRDDDYCVRVTANGFAAVGFVSALTGHRYHSRPMKEWFVSELQEALGSSVHDVQMVLNFLSTRDDLDLSNVGMFGEGSGGTIAVLAAAADPRIKVLDLLDPWGDWPDWVRDSSVIPDEERANYLKPEYLHKVVGLDPVQWLPQLKNQHIRIQQVIDDMATPKAAKERIDAVAPPSTTVLRYDDSMGLFNAASGGRVFDWVKAQLRPIPPSQPAAAVVQKNLSTPGTAAEPGHND